MIDIVHRDTRAVLYRSESAASVREAVIAAVAADADLAGANLAGANLADAYLARANLAGANLAGVDLADANLARANLADAYLAGANLADAYLAGANLAGANLADAYLAGANLAGANLAGVDLADAYLADARNAPEGTEVTNPAEPYTREAPTREVLARRAARFRARHPEVPVVEHLDAKILEIVAAGAGTLDMGAWHTCDTTHCRAGWAIHLAGEAGRDLEAQYGPFLAGGMIYRASTGMAPHFFATNERAMEDIRRCAESDGGAR